MTQEQEIKNLKYFVKKIKSFVKEYELENEKNLSPKEIKIKEGLNNLSSQIDKHIYNIKNDILYNYKKEFLNIIEALQEETFFNLTLPKPIKTDVRPYNEKVYSKLNYIFRKQKLLNEEEAKTLYENDYELLFNKYSIFLELINWLNDNRFSIIPEKTLFSAYLGISVEAYNYMLKFASNNEVRNLFTNIDEYFTTNQFGALINNDRKSLERIQKTETYGQEMRQTQPDNLIVNNTANISYHDLMLELQRKKQSIIEHKD